MVVAGIVLAGGQSLRFGADIRKPFMSLNGQRVLDYALDALRPHCQHMVVVADGVIGAVPPGVTRGESVRRAVATLPADVTHVVIHEAARPMVTADVVRRVVEALRVAPVVDTVVPVTDGVLLDGLPIPKNRISLSQTPEGFDVGLLRRAFSRCPAPSPFQDEVSMVADLCCVPPTLVPGVQVSTKLTYPQDWANLEGLLSRAPAVIPPRVESLHRSVMVLGATGVIGSAVVERLHAVGARVRAGRIDLMDADIDFRQPLHEVTAVVHAAGVAGHYEDTMRVHYLSLVALVQQAVRQQWRGNIVVVSSTAASYGRPEAPTYAASKAAVNSYIQGVHGELAERGILINAVAPGRVQSPLQTALSSGAVFPEDRYLPASVVAEAVVRYVACPATHGQILYLPVGFSGMLSPGGVSA